METEAVVAESDCSPPSLTTRPLDLPILGSQKGSQSNQTSDCPSLFERGSSNTYPTLLLRGLN